MGVFEDYARKKDAESQMQQDMYGDVAEFNMDQFEQDYRSERRKALRNSYESGETSFPALGLLSLRNRIGENVSDTVQGIGAFAKSLYNNPQAVAEAGAEGLEDLYNRIAQGDAMAAMEVAGMVATGGTSAALLRGGRIAPSALGSGGGNIIRGSQLPPVVFRQSPDYIYGGGALKDFDVDAAPFQKRITGLDQVNDMIESGYVRVKPTGANSGGNNPQTIYFGPNKVDSPETANPTVSSFSESSISSSEHDIRKNVALIGKSEEMHKYVGKPIPISALKHAWKTLENGELVDILPDILKANQNR